jgi:hypothetical protein
MSVTLWAVMVDAESPVVGSIFSLSVSVKEICRKFNSGINTTSVILYFSTKEEAYSYYQTYMEEEE